MDIPDKNNQEEYATYHLFLVHAHYKNSIRQVNDSLINLALNYYEKYGSIQRRALALYCVDRVHSDLHNTLKATDYFIRSKELADQTNDYNLRALICIHFRRLCRLMDLFDKALLLNVEAYQNNQVAGDSTMAIYSLRNIAWCYDELGQLDSALCYHQKALSYAQLQPEVDINLVYSVISGIALVYRLQGDYYKSIQCLMQMEDNKISSSLRENKNYLLGENYYSLGNSDSAYYYLSQVISSDNIYRFKGVHRTLSEIARSTGRYEEALRLNDAHLQACDSIETFKLSTAIAEIQEKYDYEIIKC